MLSFPCQHDTVKELPIPQIPTGKEGKNRFTKADRIRKTSDYKRLSTMGRRLKSSGFVIVYQKNTAGRPRLGITVSKKIGKAVNRNKIKRIIREYFRTNKSDFHGEWDINVIVRTTARMYDTMNILQELKICLVSIKP